MNTAGVPELFGAAGANEPAVNVTELDDPLLLDRATALGQALFTRHEDLLAGGVRRPRNGEPFAGIFYAHQLRETIGQCINEVEWISEVYEPAI